MDKVHSVIKSLKCVDILQVNIEEDKEVVNSGSGTGNVKNEEIETDASKNAEDPIQDINNPSESDEEDREPPVHTGTTSERKRKGSAASDASTSPKTRKKVKTDKDNSTQQSKTGFDERCNQLLQFKEEFGHCNFPSKYAGNPSLGYWCSDMRTAYTKLQKGMKTNLSQGRIERLEEIGFQWKIKGSFEMCCCALIAFKEEFGHCNVPTNSANPSLGYWCSDMRKTYKKIQKGMKVNYNLSQDRIERLEVIGFKWQASRNENDKTFEKRCRELTSFKEEFGHCNIPQGYSGNPSLGRWSSVMRQAYKKIQNEMNTRNLSQARIERLEEIGFEWKVNVTFEEHCRELIAFKEEFGHLKNMYAIHHWDTGVAR